jgi:hypothetical protein
MTRTIMIVDDEPNVRLGYRVPLETLRHVVERILMSAILRGIHVS